MKTETKYICEKCGWKWDTEEKCAECEASHSDAITIGNMRYDHKFGDSAKYPSTVTLEMANNKKVEYRFYKEV